MKWCFCSKPKYMKDGVCVYCGGHEKEAGEFKIISADPKQIDIVKEIVHQNTMILKLLGVPHCLVGPWNTDKEE